MEIQCGICLSIHRLLVTDYNQRDLWELEKMEAKIKRGLYGDSVLLKRKGVILYCQLSK